MRQLLIGFCLGALGSFSSVVGSSIRNTQVDGPSSIVETHQDRKTVSHPSTLTKNARLAFMRRAQVWTRIDIPTLDLRVGPQARGAFEPNQMVICDYVETRMHGSTPKFHCAIDKDDVVKVKYGAHNGEVEGAVLATRLLWALGFTADRVYPVRVTCRGCAADPWHHRARVSDEHVFDPAVIERKPSGVELYEGERKAGWAWHDLDLVDESLGGAPVQQRDALKLLAVFMQHTDTRPPQQRLLCVAEGFTEPAECEQPFMFLHDVGKTFGHANAFNRGSSGSVDLDAWARTPIWKDPGRCIGHLTRSLTGTLGDPHISEAGRSFLASLLLQLTDRQVRDLFEVARVDRRTGSHSGASVDDWIAAFNRKRMEIAAAHCPA